MDIRSFDAVVFDFDGLIIDTETPLFEAWAQTFTHFGADPISLQAWAVSLGRHDDDPLMLDPMAELRRQSTATGSAIDEAAVQRFRRRRRDELLDAQGLRPGVADLLGVCAGNGTAVAIASSSPSSWIDPLLDRLGVGQAFAVQCNAGNGTPGKPDPAVYTAACDRLGVAPADALALEDSPNGIQAAKRAGLTCVAVPTSVSASLDLGAADAVVESLTSLVAAATR